MNTRTAVLHRDPNRTAKITAAALAAALTLLSLTTRGHALAPSTSLSLSLNPTPDPAALKAHHQYIPFIFTNTRTKPPLTTSCELQSTGDWEIAIDCTDGNDLPWIDDGVLEFTLNTPHAFEMQGCLQWGQCNDGDTWVTSEPPDLVQLWDYHPNANESIIVFRSNRGIPQATNMCDTNMTVFEDGSFVATGQFCNP